MDVSAVLAAVRSGELDTKEAEKMLKKLPYEDLGYAKIDHHRRVRQGAWRRKGSTCWARGLRRSRRRR